MIPKELEQKIVRHHYADHWPIGTIARQLGIHHQTVARVLINHGVDTAQVAIHASMIDPYLPFIQKKLELYPTLTAKRLYDMVRDLGYPGAPGHFRGLIARIRPRKTPEAFLRLRTLPGEQGQVDWAHFGRLKVGRALRSLYAFVMVLSYSRLLFFRFYTSQTIHSFLDGHRQALEFFQGCPRVLLYDNLKSAVLERMGDAIRFNPELIALAAHYRFEPRPVAVARGNEKGRVERAIKYIRDAFFAGRELTTIDALNAAALTFCLDLAPTRRCPDEVELTIREAFEREEPVLLKLPDNPYPTDERLQVHTGKTPYVRFDLNDYSVPHTLVRKTLVVFASQAHVRIFEGTRLVATHPRSFDRDVQVETPEHLAALVDYKRKASRDRGLNHLVRSCPKAKTLLEKLAAAGYNLGSATASLVRLLDSYGAAELSLAIEHVLSLEAPQPHQVRHLLEKRRAEQKLPPPLPVALPDDRRVRELAVTPHDLKGYDTLTEKKEGTK